MGEGGWRTDDDAEDECPACFADVELLNRVVRGKQTCRVGGTVLFRG